MSAFAYIQYDDIPAPMIESALRHKDMVTNADLIAFDDCPFSGEISVTSAGITQIEFAWPINRELRHALGDWFTYHGINFTVVM